jgi:hypothetical protein
MRNKILLIFSITAFIAGQVFGQNGTGTLKGTVKDNKGEPVPFANVAVKMNGNLVTGGTTDFDGLYTIKSLPPGKYDVEASYTGFQPQLFKNVVVMVDKVVFQDFTMTSGVNLKEVIVQEYKVPLIEKDAGATSTTITSDDFKKMPNRSAEAAATTVAGVYSKDGSVGSIRGSRDGSSDTYIDGVKVRGGASLPQMAIEQVQVLLGGLPAQYGDVTTGIISVTTKGPSKKYFGGFEYVTSEPFDKYGYNLLAFNLSGPIVTKRDTTQPDKKRPLIGFFLAGELKYEKDQNPSALGAYRVKGDVLSNLEQNPVRPSTTFGSSGSLLNSQFVRSTDIENVKARQNVGYYGVNVAGKVDFNLTKNTNFTVGGSYDANKQRIYSYANSLFNYKKNGELIDNTSRVYARITQRFNDNPESKSVVKNIIYMLNVDYQRFDRVLQDADHKDKLFDYGYVGKFKTYRENTYQYGVDPTTGLSGYLQNSFRDTLFEFTPGTINPLLANYTSQYYGQHSRDGFYNNWNQVQAGIGPLLNSEQPDNVYDIWYNTGREYGVYQKLQQEQYRVTGLASADIKNHSFTLGFEYEQRVDRAITYQSPFGSQAGFWQLINPFSGLVNKHITELDLNNPILGLDANGNFNDTISYPYIYNQETQSFFDYNLRQSLGLNPQGTDWIDVNTLSPDQLDISWFSPDELLNGGNSYVSYFGYDIGGNKVGGKPSLDDFFTSKDDKGNFKRTVGAFQPIYFAGYIQDKFVFKDLIFNVGLRVDRFDANQKVLNDPWVLYETKKAGEVSVLGNQSIAHPSNIGNDYVVYVNDINNPTAIVGYRNGRDWYNAQGAPIVDPSVLRTSSGIAPYLVNPADKTLNTSAFKDYEPQTNLMPRISFSFPISEDALFYAHYDVLYKRPTTGVRLDPTDYYYMTVRAQDRNNPINNPALKPEKTVDYELGFRQVLSKSSALNISAFYREIRNLIQVVNVAEAYPATYNTYGNLDFGTVKGLSISYEMRRTDNFQLRANYTLQFADGTGSTTSSGLNLINSGQPNLRVPQPLDFDQRHTIQIVADYHFQKDQGFRIGKIYPLANMGLNLIGRIGSGTPYTKKRNPSPTQNLSGGVAQQVEGAINGSRYPVNFNIDLRIDKDFFFKVGKKGGEGEDKRKQYSFNLYLQILNLLNTRNVYEVYSYTGNPNDDGYLTASEFQNSINSQNDPQSFRDLYNIKVNNPNNYSLPRRMRIGLIFNF